MKLNLTRPIMESKETETFRYKIYRKMVDGSFRFQEEMETEAHSPEEALKNITYRWANKYGVGNRIRDRVLSVQQNFMFKPVFAGTNYKKAPPLTPEELRYIVLEPFKR